MDAERVLHEQHMLYSCVQQIWFGLDKLYEKTMLQSSQSKQFHTDKLDKAQQAKKC